MIFKINKKYFRNNKLTFNDAHNYSFINDTKSKIVIDLNYHNLLSTLLLMYIV